MINELIFRTPDNTLHSSGIKLYMDDKDSVKEFIVEVSLAKDTDGVFVAKYYGELPKFNYVLFENENAINLFDEFLRNYNIYVNSEAKPDTLYSVAFDSISFGSIWLKLI